MPRLRAVEMLSIWIASEAIEPDLIRIAPRLLEADSAFVALQREIAKLVEHYRHSEETYDTAHWRLCLTSVKIKLTICAVVVPEPGLVRQ